MRVLVVGMNPSIRSSKKSSPTLKKLNELMTDCGIHHYSFINTPDETDTVVKAQIDRACLKAFSKSYDKVIALGNFASEVLNTISVPHFKLPHPSPRNRLLNHKLFEVRVVNGCREYVHH